ncbi:MAG: thiamine phosphate synthase [Halobacteriota archaeon]
MDFTVYFITSRDFGRSHEEIAELALKAGVKTIQFRDKNMNGREMLRTAMKLKKWCDEFGATFIVNDRIDVALLCKADGVHVGQEDIPAHEARRIFKGIVGVSVHNVEEAVEAEKYADYVGAGPVFATSTKKDARTPIGLKGLKEIVDAVSIPVVAIGSINSKNISDVLEVRVDGFAVISAIAAAKEPAEATKGLLDAIKNR